MAATALDGVTDGPFIVVQETNTSLSAQHYELADAQNWFNKVRVVGNTNRQALYDGQLNRVRTASLTFDGDQWEECDRIAATAVNDGQDHEETTPVVGANNWSMMAKLYDLTTSLLHEIGISWEFVPEGLTIIGIVIFLGTIRRLVL